MQMSCLTEVMCSRNFMSALPGERQVDKTIFLLGSVAQHLQAHKRCVSATALFGAAGFLQGDMNPDMQHLGFFGYFMVLVPNHDSEQ